MNAVVTGCAGFIGFHVTKRLINEGIKVIGIDNLNNYYDVNLKKNRLNELDKLSSENSLFNFYNYDLTDYDEIFSLFSSSNPEICINLAAQAGVRYSIQNPKSYIKSNIEGFGNILECCRHNKVKHLIYASSSSVYGGNTQLPFKENRGADHPVSLYGATKKANELMAHSYSHLYGIPTTGLRFFTVYGPWGRPDMALFLFTKAMIENKPIKLFNKGQMKRDFTYIDDIVESIYRLIDKPGKGLSDFDCSDPSNSWAPFKVFNIGNSQPVELMSYVKALEKSLNIKAKYEFLPMQLGDVVATSADTSALEEWVGFKPSTTIENGVANFVDWYKRFYK